MLKDLISKVLNQHVGKFFKNLDASLFKVSLLKGSIVLRGLEVDPAVFAEIEGFPFALVHGYVDHLVLHIPWTNLMNKPIKVAVTGIALLFCPKKLPSTIQSHSKSTHAMGDGSEQTSQQQQRQARHVQAARLRKAREIDALELIFASLTSMNSASAQQPQPAARTEWGGVKAKAKHKGKGKPKGLWKHGGKGASVVCCW